MEPDLLAVWPQIPQSARYRRHERMEPYGELGVVYAMWEAYQLMTQETKEILSFLVGSFDFPAAPLDSVCPDCEEYSSNCECKQRKHEDGCLRHPDTDDEDCPVCYPPDVDHTQREGNLDWNGKPYGGEPSDD